MTAADMTALVPLVIIATASVGVMLTAAFVRRHLLTVAVTLLGFALAGLSLPLAATAAPRRVTPLLVLDDYAIFYLGLIFAAGLVVTLLAYSYLEGRDGAREEFYVLLLLSTLGAAVLVASSHFASFFLGLELLSVALYALIAYLYTAERPLEAGLKYLVLAGASSAFLLFGMALVYAELGTMEFAGMAAALAGRDPARAGLLLMGLAMIMTGVGFKLAVVPFHMWTPDVYEGAPAPVTAFVATVSKGAMFALLLRAFTQAGGYGYGPLLVVFGAVAVVSMFAGNLLALLQDNIKRILAYSSIAHLGYLLVAFLAGGALAVEAVTYYLVAYFVTTLGAFGIVTVLSDHEREADSLDDYRGLFWRRPWLAMAFTAMLLSLAGIPLTAGFVGKFYVLAAGITAALWPLVVLLVLNSAIGLFYYLRIVVAMYLPAPAGGPGQRAPALRAPSLVGHAVLAVLTFLLVWLGVYPAPFLSLIRTTFLPLA
ncbi:MAG: NADH-quinone oxidoreductase subunit N [Thermodesulfobacteriota bacterium]